MNRMAVLLVLATAALPACSSEFAGGGATGAALGVAGAGAGYEINAKRRLDQLNKDLQAGRITEQEYEIRKKEIGQGSLIY